MSAALRIALCALPFAASILLGWRGMNEHMAQGAPFFGPSAYGLLLFLWMITLASLVPILGGLASVVLAQVLRLRPPDVVGGVADRWLAFLGPAVFFGAAWLAWSFMWQVDRPSPTRYAPYGTSYFWLTAWVGASWATAFGAAAYSVIVREVRTVPHPRASR